MEVEEIGVEVDHEVEDEVEEEAGEVEVLKPFGRVMNEESSGYDTPEVIVKDSIPSFGLRFSQATNWKPILSKPVLSRLVLLIQCYRMLRQHT